MVEAAAMLGVTERTFRRWSVRYEADGLEGVLDGRIGRPSGRAVPVEDVMQLITWYQTRYTGWTVKHFYDQWQHEHGGRRSYRWLKKTLQAAGGVARAPRRASQKNDRGSRSPG